MFHIVILPRFMKFPQKFLSSIVNGTYPGIIFDLDFSSKIDDIFSLILIYHISLNLAEKKLLLDKVRKTTSNDTLKTSVSKKDAFTSSEDLGMLSLLD